MTAPTNISDALVLELADLADRCLDGAECLYDRYLHDGPDDPKAETPADRAAREEVAAEICASCAVRQPCLDYALLARPARGIWAGLTAAEVAGITDSRSLIPAMPAMGYAAPGRGRS